MKNRFLLFLTCISFITSPLCAANTVTTDVTPFLGYRHDNLKWTTNTGSSFKWKNLSFIEYGLKNKTTFRDRYVINYDLGLANLLSGRLQDNQYLIPNGPSTSSSIKGWGLGVSPNIGLGYKFKPNKWLNISPQVGYSYDLLYIKDNRHTGPFSSVKDTVQWQGPWTGFDAKVKMRRWSLNLGAFYHLGFYRGNGNGKISPVRGSIPQVTAKNTFSQKGTGQGAKGRIGVGYEIVKSLALGAEADMDWRTLSNGNDKRTLNGVTTKDKLKKVNWDSYATRVTLTKTF